MKITCDHPASSYGQPVILDDEGRVMSYPAGLTAALKKLGWTRAEFARRCGYKPRSVDKFWQRAVPPARILNLLGLMLDPSGLVGMLKDTSPIEFGREPDREL